AILWLDYEHPSTPLQVASAALAKTGSIRVAYALASFNARRRMATSGIRPRNHVIAHSYGSALLAWALICQLEEDVANAILLGSPGAGPARDKDDFGIGDNVYVASAGYDIVTHFGTSRAGPLSRFPKLSGLGIDPSSEAFGAHRVHTGYRRGALGLNLIAPHLHYLLPNGSEPNSLLVALGKITGHDHVGVHELKDHRGTRRGRPSRRPGKPVPLASPAPDSGIGRRPIVLDVGQQHVSRGANPIKDGSMDRPAADIGQGAGAKVSGPGVHNVQEPGHPDVTAPRSVPAPQPMTSAGSGQPANADHTTAGATLASSTAPDRDQASRAATSAALASSSASNSSLDTPASPIYTGPALQSLGPWLTKDEQALIRAHARKLIRAHSRDIQIDPEPRLAHLQRVEKAITTSAGVVYQYTHPSRYLNVINESSSHINASSSHFGSYPSPDYVRAVRSTFLGIPMVASPGSKQYSMDNFRQLNQQIEQEVGSKQLFFGDAKEVRRPPEYYLQTIYEAVERLGLGGFAHVTATYKDPDTHNGTFKKALLLLNCLPDTHRVTPGQPIDQKLFETVTVDLNDGTTVVQEELRDYLVAVSYIPSNPERMLKAARPRPDASEDPTTTAGRSTSATDGSSPRRTEHRITDDTSARTPTTGPGRQVRLPWRTGPDTAAETPCLTITIDNQLTLVHEKTPLPEHPSNSMGDPALYLTSDSGNYHAWIGDHDTWIADNYLAPGTVGLGRFGSWTAMAWLRYGYTRIGLFDYTTLTLAQRQNVIDTIAQNHANTAVDRTEKWIQWARNQLGGHAQHIELQEADRQLDVDLEEQTDRDFDLTKQVKDAHIWMRSRSHETIALRRIGDTDNAWLYDPATVAISKINSEQLKSEIASRLISDAVVGPPPTADTTIAHHMRDAVRAAGLIPAAGWVNGVADVLRDLSTNHRHDNGVDRMRVTDLLARTGGRLQPFSDRDVKELCQLEAGASALIVKYYSDDTAPYTYLIGHDAVQLREALIEQHQMPRAPRLAGVYITYFDPRGVPKSRPIVSGSEPQSLHANALGSSTALVNKSRERALGARIQPDNLTRADIDIGRNTGTIGPVDQPIWRAQTTSSAVPATPGGVRAPPSTDGSSTQPRPLDGVFSSQDDAGNHLPATTVTTHTTPVTTASKINPAQESPHTEIPAPTDSETPLNLRSIRAALLTDDPDSDTESIDNSTDDESVHSKEEPLRQTGRIRQAARDDTEPGFGTGIEEPLQYPQPSGENAANPTPAPTGASDSAWQLEGTSLDGSFAKAAPARQQIGAASHPASSQLRNAAAPVTIRRGDTVVSTSDGSTPAAATVQRTPPSDDALVRSTLNAHPSGMGLDGLRRRPVPSGDDSLTPVQRHLAEQTGTLEHARTIAAIRQQAHDTAATNGAWWATLTADQQHALLSAHPREIGNTDGLPPAVRDKANRLAIKQDAAHAGPLSKQQKAFQKNARATLTNLATIEADAAELTDPSSPTTPPAVRVLAYEPTAFGGKGRILISLGDVEQAESVAWHVAGYGTTLTHLRPIWEGVRNLHQEAVTPYRRQPRQVRRAAVLWVGAEHPTTVSQTWTPELAKSGSAQLAADVAAYNTWRSTGDHGPPRNHLIAHGYGSVTACWAAVNRQLEGELSSVTLLGSPGAGPARTAAELGVGVDVYVAASSRDPVTHFGTGRPGIRSLFKFPGLGIDPATENFGARRLHTGFLEGGLGAPNMLAPHGKYLQPNVRGGRARPNKLLVALGQLSSHGLNDLKLPRRSANPNHDPHTTWTGYARGRARRVASTPIDDPSQLHKYGPPRGTVRLDSLPLRQPKLTREGTRLRKAPGYIFGSSGVPKPGDMRQGFLGDCYLLAALIDLAKNHPQWLASLIEFDDAGNLGMWWRDDTTDEWELIRADRRFPTVNGRPLFADFSEDKGFLAAFAEKTYAIKFGNNDYAGIVGGTAGTVLDRLLPSTVAGSLSPSRQLRLRGADNHQHNFHPLSLGPDEFRERYGYTWAASTVLGLSDGWRRDLLAVDDAYTHTEDGTGFPQGPTWEPLRNVYTKRDGSTMSMNEVRQWLHTHNPVLAINLTEALLRHLDPDAVSNPEISAVVAQMTADLKVVESGNRLGPKQVPIARHIVARAIWLAARGDTVCFGGRITPTVKRGSTYRSTGVVAGHEHAFGGPLLDDAGHVVGAWFIDPRLEDSSPHRVIEVPLEHINQFSMIESGGAASYTLHGDTRLPGEPQKQGPGYFPNPDSGFTDKDKELLDHGTSVRNAAVELPPTTKTPQNSTTRTPDPVRHQSTDTTVRTDGSAPATAQPVRNNQSEYRPHPRIGLTDNHADRDRNNCAPLTIAELARRTGKDFGFPPGFRFDVTGVTREELQAAAQGILQGFADHDSITEQLRHVGDGAIALVADTYTTLDDHGVGTHIYLFSYDAGHDEITVVVVDPAQNLVKPYPPTPLRELSHTDAIIYTHDGTEVPVPDRGHVGVDGIRRFDSNDAAHNYAYHTLRTWPRQPKQVQHAVQAYVRDPIVNWVLRQQMSDEKLTEWIDSLRTSRKVLEILADTDNSLPSIAALMLMRQWLLSKAPQSRSKQKRLWALGQILDDPHPSARHSWIHENAESYDRYKHAYSTHMGLEFTAETILYQITQIDHATAPLRGIEPIVVTCTIADHTHLSVDEHGTPFDGHDPTRLIGVPQHESGYLSTAVRHDTIDSADEYHMELTVPPGVKGFYIGHDSLYPDQQELLLGRDIDYHITHVTWDHDGTPVLHAIIDLPTAIDDPDQLWQLGPPREKEPLLAPRYPTIPVMLADAVWTEAPSSAIFGFFGLPRPGDVQPGLHPNPNLLAALIALAHTHPHWLASLYETAEDDHQHVGMWWHDENNDDWELVATTLTFPTIDGKPVDTEFGNVSWPAIAAQTYKIKFGDNDNPDKILARLLPTHLVLDPVDKSRTLRLRTARNHHPFHPLSLPRATFLQRYANTGTGTGPAAAAGTTPNPAAVAEAAGTIADLARAWRRDVLAAHDAYDAYTTADDGTQIPHEPTWKPLHDEYTRRGGVMSMDQIRTWLHANNPALADNLTGTLLRHLPLPPGTNPEPEISTVLDQITSDLHAIETGHPLDPEQEAIAHPFLDHILDLAGRGDPVILRGRTTGTTPDGAPHPGTGIIAGHQHPLGGLLHDHTGRPAGIWVTNPTAATGTGDRVVQVPLAHLNHFDTITSAGTATHHLYGHTRLPGEKNTQGPGYFPTLNLKDPDPADKETDQETEEENNPPESFTTKELKRFKTEWMTPDEQERHENTWITPETIRIENGYYEILMTVEQQDGQWEPQWQPMGRWRYTSKPPADLPIHPIDTIRDTGNTVLITANGDAVIVEPNDVVILTPPAPGAALTWTIRLGSAPSHEQYPVNFSLLDNVFSWTEHKGPSSGEPLWVGKLLPDPTSGLPITRLGYTTPDGQRVGLGTGDLLPTPPQDTTSANASALHFGHKDSPVTIPANAAQAL
ncbi:MAG: hypothetical protein J2P17_00855, partial [Mycobacterium sp.]|nr:hypothetical protein [Mycobacterium sp.]